MDAGPQTIESLFQSPKLRFEIPTFQRPYVWKEETQWEPLWEDVRNLAERYGELLASCSSRKEAQKKAGRHFLGAVVVQRLDLAFGGPETWELIDGQQRLTTLQLLLDATQEVFENHSLQEPALELERVVQNDRRLCKGDHAFKLWPTGSDRDAFRAAMTNGVETNAFAESRIVKAHHYFSVQVREWLSASQDETAQTRGHYLLVTLLALLELVVIKLDGTDDAFVIFETLNARGTPLLAADLVKNYVLQAAVQEGHNKDDFHSKYWREFEEFRADKSQSPWWLTDIRQGRMYRPRLDVFLNHWLVMRRSTEVSARTLFPAFKKYVEEDAGKIEPIVQNFVHVANTFKALGQWPEDSPEGVFMYRWGVVQAGVLTPVLLQLFSAPEVVLPAERRRQALRDLESYLVRRMACRLTTKDYNRLFLELVACVNADLPHADEIVRSFLLEQTAHSRVWPLDSELVDALVTLPLYGRINQGRLRMILEGLEDALRSEKSEDTHVARNLQLEHLLPQKWQTYWPLPPNSDPEAHHRAIQRRERLLHTLGNLTLVRAKLNKSVSNSAWSIKRAELAKHTTLHLNKRLLEQWGESDFEEAAITSRSGTLAALACQVWPRPASIDE